MDTLMEILEGCAAGCGFYEGCDTLIDDGMFSFFCNLFHCQ